MVPVARAICFIRSSIIQKVNDILQPTTGFQLASKYEGLVLLLRSAEADA